METKMAQLCKFFPVKLNNYTATFNGPTHLIDVHINTRNGKEMFHTSGMTFLCSKVQWSITILEWVYAMVLSTWWVQRTHVHVVHDTCVCYSYNNSILIFRGQTHQILNVHLNARSGNEMFHNSSTTFHGNNV